ERRQGAHGSAASGGPYHRGDEGGRGGLATPCSAPVLVLHPGGVEFRNRKPTAIGRLCAAVATALTGRSESRDLRRRYGAGGPRRRLRSSHPHRRLPFSCHGGMVVRRRPEKPMTSENVVKLLQMTGAALAIPAAAAGTFAAYQSYFSSDVTCQKLRSNIVAVMERNVAPETKRSLLKKDVTEF